MSDLSDEAIRAYAANIFDLEDDREQTQTDLKDAWSHIREAHGKRFADSLKLAVKRARMDSDKRTAADEVDAEAERIMAVLASRAPRATRTREIIEQFDPETGEIKTAGELVAPGVEAADHGTVATNGAAAPQATNPGGKNVAEPQAHASEQPGNDTGSVNTPAEGGAHSAAIAEPDAALRPQTGGVQTSVDQSQAGDGNARPVPAQTGGVISAPATPAGLVAVERPATQSDHTKPNPWCLDPEECGLSSWEHFCLRCSKVKAERQSVSAVQ